MIYRIDKDGLHCLDDARNGDYILLDACTEPPRRLFLDVYQDIWVKTPSGEVLICVDVDGMYIVPFATKYSF